MTDTKTRKIPRCLYASDDDPSDADEPDVAKTLETLEILPPTELAEPIKEPKVANKEKKQKKEPITKPVRKKKEPSPISCQFCGKQYSFTYALERHINDNRCYVKREKDKEEIEKLRSLPPPPPPVAEPVAVPVKEKPKRQRKPSVKKEAPQVREMPPPAAPLIQQQQKAKYLFKFN